jgi:glutamate--cysteine ligase
MMITEPFQTPHLTTSLTGPLQLIEKQFLAKQDEIESWLEAQWQKTPAPIYGSVDLRNAGFKLAPVDMNLFPGGFNNLRLNPEFIKLSADAAHLMLQKLAPTAKNILLIPENHTRNKFYWENVSAILEILSGRHYVVRVGSLIPDLIEPMDIEVANGVIKLEPIQRVGNKIQLHDFVPDMILLNNDLSDGIPDVLMGVDQLITPPAELGWSQRLKTEHFQYYADICEEFSQLVGVDPWLIAPLFKRNEDLNFMEGKGQECLVANVDTLLKDIRAKYVEYQIPHEPYVVIKANAGTYGMAVMMVKSTEELLSLNRKQRTHMSKSKGGQAVSSVIVQEGVHTFETWGNENSVAEPVVYMWGERVVGGFYRLHKDKGVDENLNTPGMHFEPLPFSKPCQKPLPVDVPDECQNRFYAYGVVARLSMLAAAREIVDQQKRSS